MQTTRLEMNYCPSCGKELDAATSVEKEARPKPGDISICFYCGSINTFQEDLKLQQMGPQEYFDLPDEVQRSIQSYVRLIKERRATNDD